MPLPIRSNAFSGEIPLRFEAHPRRILAGISMWRGVKNMEHGTLCRAFNLDPVRFFFDVASSFRGVGSMQSGAGGSGRGRARRTGLVFHAGIDEPVAKISEVLESDRFWDYDPASDDFWRLDRV